MPFGSPKSAYVAAAAVTQLALLVSPYFFRTQGLCCSGTSVRGFARVSALSIMSGNPNLYWSRTSQVCLGPNHRSQERISVSKIRAWAIFSALGSFDLSLGHRNPCNATCCPSMMPDWYQQAHISGLKASVACSSPMRTVYVPLTDDPQQQSNPWPLCFSISTTTG
ncbi:hypothetical protein BJX62DRAFT_2849 [Aspergillus germanicus]